MVRRMSVFPDWVPQVDENSCILVVGASGGIGKSLVNMMLRSRVNIGCHFSTKADRIHQFAALPNTILLQKTFKSAGDCESLIDEFVQWHGGINGLVVLSGGISRNAHWEELKAEEWESDVFLNLSVPFYLSRAAVRMMKQGGKGGRIILTGTESAQHGGGPFSLPYGASKMGIECLVKGLARDCAKEGILVNGNVRISSEMAK
jgi:3-oxoacyl-[acyl-carrier protein] reductase